MTLMASMIPEAIPLDRLLSRLRPVMPGAVERADRALGTVLAGICQSSWPEIAWRASSLTNTGYPVEFSWSSRDASVRWVAEVAGPEVSGCGKIALALQILHGFEGHSSCFSHLLPQPSQPLRFGAWIGGRHDGRHDRYKLYLDAANGSVAKQFLPPGVLHSVPSRTIWRMLGLDADQGTIELYGRLAKPEVWEMERLMVHCGFSPDPVMDFSLRLTGRPRDDFLLPGTAGISLTVRDGLLLAAGFFVHSGPLIGNTNAVSTRIRELARHHGWNTDIYDAMLGSDPPEKKPGRHGMIGFGVAADSKPWMQIGLRP